MLTGLRHPARFLRLTVTQPRYRPSTTDGHDGCATESRVSGRYRASPAKWIGFGYAAVVLALLASGCASEPAGDVPCVGAGECGAPTPFGELAGRCYAGVCCTGCWDGHECHDGLNAAACGYHGDTCVQCGEGYACKQASANVAGVPVVAAQLCQSSARTVCITTDGVVRCYDCGEVGQRCCDHDACSTGAQCIVDMFNQHFCGVASSGN